MTFNDPSTLRLRAIVSAALGRVDALLAAPPEAPGDVQPWTATAAVGGADLDLASRATFADPRWLAGYRPGRERGVYVASCADLMLLGHSLDVDLAKVGTCAPARLAHRIHELRRDRTGACHHDGERLLRSADGWKDWFARPLRPLAGPSPGSPVTVSDRLLTVRLPDTLRWQDFDAVPASPGKRSTRDRSGRPGTPGGSVPASGWLTARGGSSGTSSRT